MAESRTARLSRAGTTFLSRRFDRDGDGYRVHFASAMTMLGAADGESGEHSYLDIADFLMRHGAAPREDLSELWRRIVFSIAVSNTDDHLRNHGFLLAQDGWRLSPAYDINPNPASAGTLALCIDRDDATADFSVALRVAPQFRLSSAEADAMLARVREAVASWRAAAAAAGITARQIDETAPAFRIG
jgi:serine/threonine-protein kinase HipA